MSRDVIEELIFQPYNEEFATDEAYEAEYERCISLVTTHLSKAGEVGLASDLQSRAPLIVGDEVTGDCSIWLNVIGDLSLESFGESLVAIRDSFPEHFRLVVDGDLGNGRRFYACIRSEVTHFWSLDESLSIPGITESD